MDKRPNIGAQVRQAEILEKGGQNDKDRCLESYSDGTSNSECQMDKRPGIGAQIRQAEILEKESERPMRGQIDKGEGPREPSRRNVQRQGSDGQATKHWCADTAGRDP